VTPLLDVTVQVVVCVASVSSTVLIARHNRWGPVLALLVQPYWLASSYLQRQWGAFAGLSACTMALIFTVYSWFLREPPPGCGRCVDAETRDREPVLSTS
jgi:hypothetical protein